MKKTSSMTASVREMKAAALDSYIKTELEKTRVANAAKMNRLKALRLAQEPIAPLPTETKKRASAPSRRG